MQEHLETCANAASEHIDSLIKQEHNPFTNRHYFMEYRSKFFAQYKGVRLREKSDFIRNLLNIDDGIMMQAMNEAMSALTRMGLDGIDTSLLSNLSPPDPMEPALGIMADVRAYFQGSYSFISYLPSPVADLNVITLQWHTNGLWTMSPWVSIERCCGG